LLLIVQTIKCMGRYEAPTRCSGSGAGVAESAPHGSGPRPTHAPRLDMPNAPRGLETPAPTVRRDLSDADALHPSKTEARRRAGHGPVLVLQAPMERVTSSFNETNEFSHPDRR